MLEIQYLKEFTELARLGNFTAAAQTLYLSQPTLTKHIKALENELQAPLFSRARQGLRLTEQGRELLPFAIRICEEYDKLQKKFGSHRDAPGEELRLLFVPHLFATLTQPILRFAETIPALRLEEIETRGQPPEQMARECGCELLFGYESELDPARFECCALIQDCLTALLPNDHVLAGGRGVVLPEIANYPFEVLRSMPGLQARLGAILEENGIPAERVIPCESLGVMLSHTAFGHRVGLTMAEMMGQQSMVKHIAVLQVEPPVQNPICIARLRGRALSPTAQVLWDHFVIGKLHQLK